MFRYIDNQDRTFLFGAYRGEKSQLKWILGEQPRRYEKLYNVRFNKDLFTQRRGGIILASLNIVILMGNLCADPELKKTPSGVSVCTFRLGVARQYKDAQFRV